MQPDSEQPESKEDPATEDQLDFNEDDLEVIEISDDTLEKEDSAKAEDQKAAKKLAKKILSPEEKKRQKIKRILIGSSAAVAVLVALLGVPYTRWAVLNVVGLRSDVHMTILQKSTSKPVALASVKLASGAIGTTDKKGNVNFSQQRLGKQNLLIQKDGYGDLATSFTNGLGTSKPVFSLKVIGIKLDVDVTNWLSDAAIEGATVSYGKSKAISDPNGRASLIIPPTDSEAIDVEVSAEGYLTKKISTKVDALSREVTLVSAQKDYFISRRGGNFDIFSSNLDGSDQQKIVEATGKEDSSLLQFSVSRNNKQAILVATRDGKLQNGKIIAGIYAVDLERATIKKIDEASDVQLLDWGENSIAYTKSVPELNYDDPTLNRLMSFNVATGKLSELAQTNYFAVAITAQNKVFYLPADAYRAIENGTLTSQDLTSGAKKTYLSGKAIRYATRASFNTIRLQDSTNGNYELQVPTGATKNIDTRPTTNLSFALSPNGQQTAWTDQRDGQGALLTSSVKSFSEKLVTKAGGLSAPVRFISDDLVVVRVATSQETADYVVSLSTGKIAKIVDVSNVGAYQSGNL